MDKIEISLSIPTLKLLVDDIKACGKTIGFTHGGFDLFHTGHLHLLKEAAKSCDFLIVGVESDANLAEYKGVSRPIISEIDRQEIVNNISCVGNTFIITTPCKDEEYCKLYKSLKIDVLNIGSNFFVLQKAIARSKKIGFKLNVIDIINPVHTTTIINKIQSAK